MADCTEDILKAIQQVSIVDYDTVPDGDRPSHVGEVTAAAIYNAVRAAEGRCTDPAEDWQRPLDGERGTFFLWHEPDGDGRLSVWLTHPHDPMDAIRLDSPEKIDDLIARLRRARAFLIGTQQAPATPTD